jgi:hypothetical protein
LHVLLKIIGGVMSEKDFEKKLATLALTHLFGEGRIDPTSGKKITRAFVGERLGRSGAHIGGVASGRNWTPDIRKDIAGIFGYTDQQLLSFGQHIHEGKDPKEWEPYETFELSGAGVHSIKGKPKACITCLDTNRHMQDIAAWINTQDEPEMHWAELKSHLRRIEPDFAEFLKKRSRENTQDTAVQRPKTG